MATRKCTVKDEDKERDNTLNVTSAIAAKSTPNGQRVEEAAEHLIQADEVMGRLAKSREKCSVPTTAGYAAEVHHKYTFEANAILKGEDKLSVALGPRGGRGSKGSADLVIKDGGRKVVEAGSKYCKDAEKTMIEHSNPFDRGRQKICPSDQVSKIRSTPIKGDPKASTNLMDTKKRATDRLKYKDVESKPLSKQEAEKLVHDRTHFTKEALKTELTNGTANATLTGAGFAAATSTIANAIDLVSGKKDVKEAGKEVAKETIKSGLRSGTTHVTATAAKHALIKAGAKNLAKGNAPMAIATTIVEAGSEVCADIQRCRNGEITKTKVAVNAVKHTAEAGTKTGGALAGAEIGATLGAIGGPVGAAIGGVVGGTVGYVATSSIMGKIKSWF